MKDGTLDLVVRGFGGCATWFKDERRLVEVGGGADVGPKVEKAGRRERWVRDKVEIVERGADGIAGRMRDDGVVEC